MNAQTVVYETVVTQSLQGAAASINKAVTQFTEKDLEIDKRKRKFERHAAGQEYKASFMPFFMKPLAWLNLSVAEL